MAPLRTLAALVLGASAASAFAPASPLTAKTVAPVVRYEVFSLEARRSFKCFSSLNFIILAHVEVEKSRICHFWGSVSANQNARFCFLVSS